MALVVSEVSDRQEAAMTESQIMISVEAEIGSPEGGLVIFNHESLFAMKAKIPHAPM